jgi:hypothetical protein
LTGEREHCIYRCAPSNHSKVVNLTKALKTKGDFGKCNPVGFDTKMDTKQSYFIVAILVLTVLFSTMASAAELKDTQIDFTPYREIVTNDPGVIYKIKIINTGNREKAYELVPDTTAVKQVGTYRIDPEYSFTLGPDEERISYFYLAFDSMAQGRVSVPLQIISGNQNTTIELAARPITIQQARYPWIEIIRLIVTILLIVMIILIIISFIRRGRKKKDDKEEEVETYY